VIQNPGFLPDHPQNWITGSLCHSRHTLKISERSVHNFLSYLADTQTDKQTKSGKNITSMAEIKMIITSCQHLRTSTIVVQWYVVLLHFTQTASSHFTFNVSMLQNAY